MREYPEFVKEKQGRPAGKDQLDMETKKRAYAISLSSLLHLVDDEPVDGATTSPISSNWAYDFVEEQEDFHLNDLRLQAALDAICEDEIDWDDVDPEDVEELVGESLDQYLKKEGGTLTGQLLLSDKGITYDDIRTPVNALKLSGVKPPTWTSYKGGEVLAFSDQALAGNEEIVFFTLQMPHNYKEGTDISIHPHFVPEDNTGGNVYWLLTYSWANIDAIFPTETTVYIAAACGTTTDAHRVAYFADIDGDPDGVKKLISSMLICKLQRRSSDPLDTYNGKSVYLLEVDVHYQVDSLGSSTALVK